MSDEESEFRETVEALGMQLPPTRDDQIGYLLTFQAGLLAQRVESQKVWRGVLVSVWVGVWLPLVVVVWVAAWRYIT